MKKSLTSKRFKAQLLDAGYYGIRALIASLIVFVPFLSASILFAKSNEEISRKMFLVSTIVFIATNFLYFSFSIFRDLYKDKRTWGYKNQHLVFVDAHKHYSSFSFALIRTVGRLSYYILFTAFIGALTHITLQILKNGRMDVLDLLMRVEVASE